MNYIKNQTYKWAQILDGSEAVAGPVFYLLHRRGTQIVTAACLDVRMNPRAPYEIIPANGERIAPWADNLCHQNTPVRMFVREVDDEFYYRGQFKVVGQSDDPHQIRLRAQQANREDIYKIIFLAEVS